MKTDEIREKYLDFFQGKGHTRCASDVLVPKWDNTVLFTPAGMNPFKDHFLGRVELEFTRATSCQKCLRTGDIENVGRTAYHHTFFEMLGNFSFGDYFKQEAIVWAWEFLTDPAWLGLDADRLTVSVYLDDDQAEQIWMNDVGLPKSRIQRLGEHDNFWPAGAPSDGPDGVCGPCSEIFYHPEDGPECEIWNLVFTQFERAGDPPDNLSPLPSQNIDTGMGLERIAAVMQGKKTNYHIDSLLPLVMDSGKVCGTSYEAESDNGRRLRRIADHVRACTMAIHENVYPDKQKENYVIRRLLRRAVLQGHEMGLQDPFLYKIVPSVVDCMGGAYPDLKGTAETIAEVIKTEEESFLDALSSGMGRVESIFQQMESTGQKQVDGRVAFDLYQEQGIPAELFEMMANQRELEFDWDGYKQAQLKHAQDSGAGQVGVMGNFSPLDEIKKQIKSTEFLGYTHTSENATVAGLVDDQDTANQIETGKSSNQSIVLDRTSFYAESGGQVADTGSITGPNGSFAVTDVQKSGDLFVHQGHVTSGSIAVGDNVTVEVDSDRRNGIQRAHSATHIMHYALQKFVGTHAQQRGSKVEDDQLRFDFANKQPVSPEQLQQIETESQLRIAESATVKAQVIPMEQARQAGAMMLFGEKYPDPVRMVSVGDFSKELCGGTHVENTAKIGDFQIISEEAVSAGVRRLTALTGEKARQFVTDNTQWIATSASILGVAEDQVVNATQGLLAYNKSLKKQLSGGKKAEEPKNEPKTETADLSFVEKRENVRHLARLLNVQANGVVERLTALKAENQDLLRQIDEMVDTSDITAESLMEQAVAVNGIQLIVSETPGANGDLMRKLIDQLRKKQSSVAVFLATVQGSDKVTLLAGLGRDAMEQGLKAGDWVKHVAPVVGGGGGGRPDMAQAGGKDPTKINAALDTARQYIQSRMAS